MWKRTLLTGALSLATLVAGGFAYLALRAPNALPPESIQVPMTQANIARTEDLQKAALKMFIWFGFNVESQVRAPK